MNHYELPYIVSTRLTEMDIPKIQSELRDLLGQTLAEITYEETIGRRKLAYPIKNEKHGYYLAIEFDGEPEKIKTIDRELALHQAVLRHLIITRPKLTETERQKAALARQQAQKREAEQRAPLDKRPKPEAVRAAEKGKVTLAELDEKLDEILGKEMK